MAKFLYLHCQIKDIILTELHPPKFVVNLLVTVTFSFLNHFHAYEVVHQNSNVVCSQTDFVDHNVLGTYQSYSCASSYLLQVAKIS